MKIHKWQIVIVGTAVITLSLLYFFFPVNHNRVYPVCIFHRVTGLYCPGCGSQRAFSALLHGHLIKAAGYNVFFVLALPLIAWSAFVFTWNAFHKRKLQQRIFYSTLFVKTLLITVVMFWILRNIPVRPFNLLAP